MTKQNRARTIKGDTMENGYIVDFEPKRLGIVVIDGAAYNSVYGPGDDTPDYGWGPLTLSGDEIEHCGRYTFSPDAGELDRIGRHVFSMRSETP